MISVGGYLEKEFLIIQLSVYPYSQPCRIGLTPAAHAQIHLVPLSAFHLKTDYDNPNDAKSFESLFIQLMRREKSLGAGDLRGEQLKEIKLICKDFCVGNYVNSIISLDEGGGGETQLNEWTEDCISMQCMKGWGKVRGFSSDSAAIQPPETVQLDVACPASEAKFLD